MYYLSKYYELLDTVLQLLKGRPPPHFFLHTYHHCLVPLATWAWLATASSLQQIGLITNALVHVFMYHYFYLRVLGRSCWWKRYITQMQIVQFCLSACCCAVTFALWGRGAQCAGMRVMGGTFLLNLTFLVQFVGVLASNDAKARTEAQAASTNGKAKWP